VIDLAAFAAELGEPVVLPLKVSVSEDQARNMVEVLRKRLGVGKHPANGVEMHLLGESALWAGLEETAKNQLTRAEMIGFPILFVVLLSIFGSLYAAFMPLAVGVVALVVTGAIVYCLSLILNLSLFTMDAASMLGIGVAIDYSLIVLARVRQELTGANFDDARRTALTTSGIAVAVSGLTCIAALAGVLFVPIGALRSMALGAAIIIGVSVLAAITLLPAFITLLGRKRVSANIFARRQTLKAARQTRLRLSWDRWVNAVMNHPVVAIVTVGSLLLALCVPALSLRTDTGVLQQLDAKNETRIGFTKAAQLAGPGILGPAAVVLRSTHPAPSGYLTQQAGILRTIAQRLPNVRRLGPTEISRDHMYATFTVVPSIDPESPAAEQLVKRLRVALANALTGRRRAVAVGGASATQLDEVQKIASSMWKVLLAVLIISLVPLTVLLRSAILPCKAIVMNLLSVGAAYGALVIVFQWGWLDSLLNYRAPGHVDTLVPPLLLAIVFGLSTDYEVFLLSRIRERWLKSGDSRLAVAEGLAVSARTITGAAAVIVCVFAVFVGTGIPIIKEIGLGSSFAIGIDATLIRLVLVPAVMTLLGDRSWWLPGKMRRVLPSRVVAGQAQTSVNQG
jgi:RND superfamily putative drug exporter